MNLEKGTVCLCCNIKDNTVMTYSTQSIETAIGKMLDKYPKLDPKQFVVAKYSYATKTLSFKSSLYNYWEKNKRQQKKFSLNGEAAEMFNDSYLLSSEE